MDDKMMEMMEKLYSEVIGIRQDLSGVKEDVKGLGVKVDKNTLELESINGKIGILAEVQQNMIDQTENQIQEAIKPICEDISVIKAAVQNISNDIYDVSDKIEFIGMKEFNNERDLFVMKKKLDQ